MLARPLNSSLGSVMNMKTLTLFLISICVVILLLRCSQSKLPPELTEQIVESFLNTPEGRFCLSTGGCDKNELMQSLSSHVVDLNGDGIKEYLVEGNGSVFCGNRTCKQWVFRRLGGKFQTIGEGFGKIQPQATNGYHDMLDEGEVYDGLDMRILYQFNGLIYKTTKCWERKTNESSSQFEPIKCPG